LATLIRGMLGLGDSIYSRPFLAAANERGEEIWIYHAWPQLIADLPLIHPVNPGTTLRTQKKNVEGNRRMFVPVPRGARPTAWHYVNRPKVSILAALEAGLPLGPGQELRMNLPDFSSARTPRITFDRPYVLVRPCTVRREWRADSRNCRPEYVAGIADILREDYLIVVVADLLVGQEWAESPMPRGDVEFIGGELSFPELMALVQGAAALVGPVGWIVPAAMATQKPAFIVMGGQGAHNSPGRLLDPRVPTPNLHLAMPANFCACASPTHDCDRRIPDLGEQLEDWREKTGV
jgi:ADP-heptose:LPS heptosyltransferase